MAYNFLEDRKQNYKKYQNDVSYVVRQDKDFIAAIHNNVTGTHISLPVMPQNISEGISSSFAQQEIVGASAPRIVYSSTGAKQISFSLQNLTEDYLIAGFYSLADYVYALQALVYPEYAQMGGLVKPPDLTLILGDKSISCICTSVNVQWGELVRDQQILSCNVDFTFLQTRKIIVGATSIEEGR